MNDLVVAIGLVLVIEGLLWAIAPGTVLRMMVLAAQTPENQLKLAGWAAVATGVFLVWAVRG
ncbi:MAG: DUF2065 domain-containing protein [Hyphomicrobiaceae bacterium]|nr:DUF2065 domain-containing protein [Hyphomicrobiaceae bacterium]